MFQLLGKIDITLFEKEFGRIKSDEIIITDERARHIKNRHPEDYALFEQYSSAIVASPDYILKDLKNEGTVFMIKKLPETSLNMLVRLVLETDEDGLKNSVMTFYRLRESNLKKMIDKNILIYKKEES